MNNQNIIDRLYQKLLISNHRYPKWEIASIVEPLIETIKEALEEGDEVRLKNFGKFIVKTKKERKYYNIQSGDLKITQDKKIITFVQHRSLNSINKTETE